MNNDTPKDAASNMDIVVANQSPRSVVNPAWNPAGLN